MRFELNGKLVTFDGDESTPLLWAIRDVFGFTGSKYGCGVSLCGACTLYVDGAPVRACSFPVSAATGKKVTTIEGMDGPEFRAVQAAWIETDAPHCGYCQVGMVMAATALLKSVPAPTDEQINLAVTNLCRCGTYHRIREAIHSAAKALKA